MMTNLRDSFKNFIDKENLFAKTNRLLLAVSGGVDSIVLCHLCHKAGYDFAVAHCNFKLRGEESNEDEKFVENLARDLNIPFFVKQFSTEEFAAVNNLSIQVAARNLRYQWFETLMSIDPEKPFTRLVTAHHADDNIETLLMNFFKGSGIQGLKAILPKNKNIVRPLLFAFKEELIAYASQEQITYREDSSNISEKYTRNYFRNQLIPGLEKVFPAVRQNLAQNIDRFRDVKVIYDDAIAKMKSKLQEYKGSAVHIPVRKLIHVNALHSIAYEIIKDYGFLASQVQGFINLLQSDSGKYILSSSHRILKNRNWIIITPLQNEESQFVLIEAPGITVDFPAGKLSIEEKKSPGVFPVHTQEVHVAISKIEFPLLLRKWKTGDYFYPFGMYKPTGKPMKKKISRFLVDKKLSLADKENTWVLESNKKIIWVVNLRLDDRFKVTDKNKPVLKIELLFPK